MGPQKSVSWSERFESLKNLPDLLRMIWHTHRGYALTNIILRLIRSAIPFAMLYLGKLIIDEVVDMRGINSDALLSQEVWLFVGLELGLAVVSDVINRIVMLLDSLLGDLFANASSVRLMEHAARLDLDQFEDSEFYDKLERARRQTLGRTALMSQVLAQMQDIITMLFLAAGLVVFNPWLILLLVVAVIPAFLGETHFNERGYSLTFSWTPERRELDYLRFTGASDETAKEVKMFGLSDFITDRFRFLSDKFYEQNKSLSRQRAAWGSLFALVGSLGYYGAYVFIVARTLTGQLSVGDLTFLAGSFQQLRQRLEQVLGRFSSIVDGALYLKDFFDFFALEPRIKATPSPLPFPNPVRNGFVFENVGFKYPKTDKWVLRNLSFSLAAGEKLALVGENGAGKTTLVKLLARLYDPNEGRLLLDG
ncbi:MAG TPA: ABC transporter ATP-binding protein, partial [Cytophagales bacterium]|nr:ABC transporter ATP-binding protein [Cytophagales bacterium]